MAGKAAGTTRSAARKATRSFRGCGSHCTTAVCTSAILTSIACSLPCVNRGVPSAALLPSPLGAALALALMRSNASCGNNVNPHQALTHAALHAHAWHFLHLSPLCLRVRGVSHALHNSCPPRFSIVLRLTMSHIMNSSSTSLVRQVSPGKSAVPPLGTRTSGQSRLARSPRVCAGTYPSNSAWRREAECQELAKAGIMAHARCESAKSSVSLGILHGSS